jgi:hypothetical protein
MKALYNSSLDENESLIYPLGMHTFLGEISVSRLERCFHENIIV